MQDRSNKNEISNFRENGNRHFRSNSLNTISEGDVMKTSITPRLYIVQSKSMNFDNRDVSRDILKEICFVIQFSFHP